MQEDYEHCSSCFRETYNLSDNTGQDVPCAPPYSFYHFKSPLPAVGWAGLAAHEFLPPVLGAEHHPDVTLHIHAVF